MMHACPSLARLAAWSLLVLGLAATGCGGGDSKPSEPPLARPDADRSTVTVSRSQDVRADGQDTVDIQVTVRGTDGAPLPGRTVKVEVPEGTVTQPSAPTDAQGVATAALTSTSEGLRTVTASVDADGGPVTLSMRPTVAFVRPVTAGPPAKLVFTQQPGPHAVRAPFGVQVTLQDAQGHTASSSTAPVTLSLNLGGTLSGPLTASAVAGVASFEGLSIAEENTGYVLTASVAGLESASSEPFTLSDTVPPAAPVLSLASASDTSLTVRWEAVGDDGVLGTASSHDLRYSTAAIVSDADFQAATPVTGLGSPASPGTTESALLSGLTPGTSYFVALQVKDTAGNAVRSATLAVSTPYPTATRLVFRQQPQGGEAGVALAPIQVEIQDANGLVVGNANQAVTLTVQGASGAGPFTASAVQGVATFTGVRIDQAGTGYTLSASAAPLTPATSMAFSIAPASASRLELTGLASPVTAGSAQSLTVTAKDAFGNVASGYTGTVHFTSSDTLADLPPDAPFSAGDAGQRTFPVTLKTSGPQTVTAKDVALDTLTGTASPQVAPGAPAKLVFRTQPASRSVRQPMADVTVALTDAFGNTASVSSPTLMVALVGGNAEAVLSGDALSVAPVAGVATFSNLRVDQQGTGFQLEVMGAPLDDVRSEPFTIVDDVSPGSAALTFSHKTSRQVRVNWVAVGDDGTLGTATQHELRYATAPLTPETFGSATPVPLGAPQPAGSAESALVTGLTPSTEYHFALRVTDDVGNTGFSTQSTATQVDPCEGYTCTAAAPVCGEDGLSRITYTATCTDVDNAPVCQQTPVVTACTGTQAVCFQGACDTAAPPEAGQLVLSEVMHSPSAGTTEYFELTNTTGNLLNLNGLTVSYVNGSGTASTFSVGAGTVPVVVGRKGAFVLAGNPDAATNGGVPVGFAYPASIVLDGSGQFDISRNGTLLESLGYTPAFPQTVGKAMSLSSRILGSAANVYPWYWCDAEAPLPGGDFGSPGAANSACGMAATPSIDFCNIESPKTLPATTAGTSVAITSRVRGVSVTDRNLSGNDYYPYLFAELGYGPTTGSAEAWTWTPILSNGAYTATSNEDETKGTLTLSTAGSYRYGFRYRFVETGKAPSAYVYCDQAGVADPTTGYFGTVTITPPAPATDHVVISEFAVAGASANDEFIELYNPTNAEVNLAGWKLQYKSATGTAYNNSYTLPADAKIGAHRFYLVTGNSYSGTPAGDASYGAAIQLAGAVGHIRLGKPGIGTGVNEALAVDKVGYGATANSPEGTPITGTPATLGTYERKAVSTSTSATMASGGADALRGNGHDSDNNGMDFVLREVRGPQNAASAAEAP
ncbi:lamin tail domain-containing protein [Stigmatella erecta]|uniref:Lamin Tail Domain n=1 Tax=Stigmatella erecta TaxID=83460 RepID=A0A1I0HR23_9BACT|nr:lamin tail domain-containing protein [Stigmatella erecta]SET85741.1 Lamin Tail Domain [Stigmatella erecta]